MTLGIVMLITALIAFFVTSLLGIFLVPYLKKLKYGQTIKDIGPTWHQQKQGTPTMGGMMFIVGCLAAVIVGLLTLLILEDFNVVTVQMIRVVAGCAMALAYGMMGFVDDYIKVVKKRNLGLRAREKLLIQFLIAIGYLYLLEVSGGVSTLVDIPFLGQFDLGWFYYPLMLFIIIGTTNAVNLTDGVDGLAGSVTFIVAIGFLAIAARLQFSYVSILAVALAASCLGFLVWNLHPAKVFMGDTGSMFLGGAVVALAFGIDMPVLLVIIGFVYFVEALSVILQVISFKTTGKRIFKMSPIHHHFELCGWSEMKIVIVFSLVSAVCGVLAYFAAPLV